jgi:hypothetical protein
MPRGEFSRAAVKQKDAEVFMTYGELKEQIRDMGFEENETMIEAEYRSIVKNACNFAVDTIAETVLPIVREYEISATGEGVGVKRYFMPDLVAGFLAFEKHPILEDRGRYETLNDYKIENRKTFVIPAHVCGKITIFYKKRPERITAETPDSFEIELDDSVAPLIPHLASFYVWLDDDERKAVMYQNMYDDLKNQIMAAGAPVPSAVFHGGLCL